MKVANNKRGEVVTGLSVIAATLGFLVIGNAEIAAKDPRWLEQSSVKSEVIKDPYTIGHGPKSQNVTCDYTVDIKFLEHARRSAAPNSVICLTDKEQENTTRILIQKMSPVHNKLVIEKNSLTH